MSFPPTPPPRFRVGERVGTHDAPTDCGTIVAILQTTVAGTQYQVDRDDHPAGPIAEQQLVSCKEDRQGH